MEGLELLKMADGPAVFAVAVFLWRQLRTYQEAHISIAVAQTAMAERLDSLPAEIAFELAKAMRKRD